MATRTAAPGLYRREYFYFLFGAFGLVAIALMCGLTGWALLPRPQLVEAGPVERFSAGQPSLIHVQLRDGTSVPVWIVAAEQGWLAFDGRARVANTNCQYKWVPGNQRFEDPCSGFKWTRNGVLLSYPQGQKMEWRDLAQYPVVVEQGRLMINIDKLIPGVLHTSMPDGIVCGFELSCSLATPVP